MAHDHDHDHAAHDAPASSHRDGKDEHEGHSHGLSREVSGGWAFGIGIGLNTLFTVIEALYGLVSHSMALVADAAHNLSDVLGLILAWGAVWLARRAPTERRTYGFRRSTILAALANGLLLVGAVGIVIWEALGRFKEPAPVQGQTVIVVAAIGVVINGISAALFARGQKGDANVRGAFLHLLADAGVSLAVVVSGFVLVKTGWLWLDPAISLLVSVVVLWGTWGLLREATSLAMDVVPDHIDPEAVRAYLASLPDVEAVHDLHVWAMSTTETALTVHLVMPWPSTPPSFLASVTGELATRFRIHHATIQLEPSELARHCAQASPDVLLGHAHSHWFRPLKRRPRRSLPRSARGVVMPVQPLGLPMFFPFEEGATSMRSPALVHALFLLVPSIAWADAPVVPLPTPIPRPTPLEPTPIPPPTPQDPNPVARTRFVTDPITDFGIIGLSIGFGAILELINSTGELRPQQPVDKSNLLGIDRSTITRNVSKSAIPLSNVGLFTAGGYAVLAPLISAYRFGGETGWNDALMFAETVALTTSVTSLAKIAVRRPRPLAYQRQEELEQQYPDPATRPPVTGTDTALSFFSGHASVVASIGATATYLSFARSPGTAWPWITLGASAALTTFVSYERVAAGKHFPTDVIAGSLAGTAIGLIVPHLHREQTTKQRPVWIGGGFSETGGTVTLQGMF